MKNIVFFFFLFSTFASYGQKHIKQSIYSKSLNDTISFDTWLPENWTLEGTYTTIYTFSYGASDGKFIAEQINYLNKLRIATLPPTIVISIAADMNMMGYNYETGLLTNRGLKTIDCIEHEIIPLIEKKYKASKFRTYIGQSYGASYGNYLFQFKPEIFSAYIIVSPEKIATQQPSFEITTKLTDFYKDRKTYYYIASGALDLQRRQDYANEVFEKIKSINNSEVALKYENIANAGHNNSTAIALPIALEFIYQDYLNFPTIDNENSTFQSIKNYEKEISDVFGLSVDKNSFAIYNYFLTRIVENKDSTNMVKAVKYFVTENSSVIQLRDFAFTCNIVGLNERSKYLYKQAIKAGSLDERKEKFYPAYLITAYREYALLADKPSEGWALLQKAEQICLKYKSNIYNGYYPEIYFYLGRYAADKNINVKSGLNYLLQYEKHRDESITLNQFNLDLVYYYIGYSYVLLNNKVNAKIYLNKCLEINKQNQKAEQLLETLN